MHTTPTRPWHNAILLFSFLCTLPVVTIIFAEDGTTQGEPPPMTCEEVFRFCEVESHGDSDLWKQCVGELQSECLSETIDGATTEDTGEDELHEWDEGGDNDEGDNGEEEEESAEDDEGETDKEQWLADFEENLDSLDEETRKCAEEKIHAAMSRCEVSSVPGCAATVSMKKLITEAQCGAGIFDVVELEKSGAGEDHDFQESFEEHREGGGGCVPFHATLEGVKKEMFGMAPEEILAEFERRKHWMAKMAAEHGGDPEEMLREYESFSACEDFRRGGTQGPSMGMPGMMGPGGGEQGASIGEIFGRAVGMLVELSQQPGLDESQKALVRETLAWFSDALNRIGSGEDVGPFAAEARQKLEHLMETMGGGSFMGGPNIEMLRSEVERMLTMVQMMTEKIPKAMSMMKDMGYEVEGWEPLYEEIKVQAAKVEEICREKLSATSSPEEFRECFDAMHRLFEEKMNAMGEYVGKSVPPEAMNKVEREMGFDTMGMPGGENGPGGMEHRGEEGGYPVPMNRMPPNMMKPEDGMHMPPYVKDMMHRCNEEQRSEEECRQMIEREMMRSLMECDREKEGDFGGCSGDFNREFGLPPPQFDTGEEE